MRRPSTRIPSARFERLYVKFGNEADDAMNDAARAETASG